MATISIEVPDSALDDYYKAAVEYNYQRPYASAVAEARATGLDQVGFLQGVVAKKMQGLYQGYLSNVAQQQAVQQAQQQATVGQLDVPAGM